MLLLIFLFIIAPNGIRAEISIQGLIDQAQPGDELIIPTGIYYETLRITKPLTIAGEGVTLYNNNDELTVHIQANHVSFKGFTIYHSHSQSPAVLVEGDDNSINDVHINSHGTSLQLLGANRNELQQILIEREQPLNLAETNMGNRNGNGIDLFNSHNNVIRNNTLINQLDGIYIESSNGNKIEYNKIYHSRYGFHFMFVEDTLLESNEASFNITGAMIMGSSNLKIINNVFSKQSYHVHSQGLLLYDVHLATVKGNLLSENVIGLYLERSNENQITQNKLKANFVGIQIKRAESNDIYFNDFFTNVIGARVTESELNDVRENYWDTLSGLDFTGNGRSDLPFQSDPIFLSLVERKPPYQILSQSPGLLFLDMLLDFNDEAILKDSAPLMGPHSDLKGTVTKPPTHELFLYLFMVGVSITLLYGGIRK